MSVGICPLCVGTTSPRNLRRRRRELEPESIGSGVKLGGIGEASNVVEAAANGAMSAVAIAASVAAGLIAFLGLVSLLNALTSWLSSLVGAHFNFEQLVGWALWPLAFCLGVPPADCRIVGQLIGTKVISNEFVAFQRLSELQSEPGAIGARASAVATYALCGFANLSSCGMLIGACSGMVPDPKAMRRKLSRDVLLAMVAGNLACFSTACVASALLQEGSHEFPEATHSDSACSM